jgi:hypothetical protein
MNFCKRFCLPLAAFLLLTACNPGLAPSLHREVSLENDRVADAQRQLTRASQKLNDDLARAPDLFRDSPEPASWKARLSAAQDKLRSAQNNGAELTKIVERNRPDPRLAQLLAQERELRGAALQESQTVEAASAKWLSFQRDPSGFLANMSRQRESIRSFDLTPVAKVVEKAEKDWPAKKTVLENRLSVLREIPKTAEAEWQATESVRQQAAAGKASGGQVATLIAEADALTGEANRLTTVNRDLQATSGQLYDSWDKILTDLDASKFGRDETLYRERIKTVRTHFAGLPLKNGETHSDERWTDVSAASYHAVEKDLGMAIAHKDAGLFDSEALNTPQPPGFSYIASPSVGSNQYGYWSHAGGTSVWTFLPEYLILRQLLWNRDYRPVMVNEYNSYWTAQRSGRPYYGQETPSSAPKYGTHGTFTQTHYANSRYVQSGGFRGSAYASRGANQDSSFSKSRSTPSFGSGDSSGGRRFGRQPGAVPSGQRFGHQGGGGSRPSGRAFGGGRRR